MVREVRDEPCSFVGRSRPRGVASAASGARIPHDGVQARPARSGHVPATAGVRIGEPQGLPTAGMARESSFRGSHALGAGLRSMRGARGGG